MVRIYKIFLIKTKRKWCERKKLKKKHRKKYCERKKLKKKHCENPAKKNLKKGSKNS